MSTVSRSASRKGRQSSGASEGKTIADAARDAAVNSKVTVSTAAVATELPAMSSVPEHAKQSPASQIVSAAALLGICIMSFSLRLFSVIKYESVIHEFDPYFNYRVTSFLTKYGFSDTWNWFDDRTWYPLGRVIGGTMYPGLIFTAGAMWNALQWLNIPIHIQEVCVFTAPLFSALCALSAYLLVKEIRGQGAGLCAAAFMGLIPSYISRSVAGSFDLEGVAIFALVFTFYLYVKALNTGSLAWATANCLAYYYMVASWGGYTFIINLLPIHCLACVFTGQLTAKLYIAFAPLILIGTIEAASIPVIGFNAVLMSEHFGSFFALAVLHAALAIQYIKGLLSPKMYQKAKTLVLTAGIVALGAVASLVFGYVMASPTFGWTGRSLSLLDPTYASKYIPIIASVSEHQPPAWASYFTDLHAAALLMPAGLVSCFRPLTPASLFLILYGATAVYFSGVMVRLMLVLAPAACCLAGIAAHEALLTLTRSIRGRLAAKAQSPMEGAVNLDGSADKASDAAPAKPELSKRASRKAADGGKVKGVWALPFEAAIAGLVGMLFLMVFFTAHSVWVSSEMYSAPSIVLQSRSPDGSVHVFDDFRESYAWLNANTHDNAKVASWWDYGYQTTAMANRTVIVDNNTWNNTHIATVGRAMSSPERKAWQIYRSLDVDYVLVVFGGFIGYPSDDINKFLWMVRIGGGVFPEIKEKDYLGNGNYRVDSQAGKALLDCLMYKLSYFRFSEASLLTTGRKGFDRVRNVEIGVQDIKLRYFEEVFTTEHWMVRIYRVLDRPVRDQRMGKRSKGLKRRQAKRRTPSGALA